MTAGAGYIRVALCVHALNPSTVINLRKRRYIERTVVSRRWRKMEGNGRLEMRGRTLLESRLGLSMYALDGSRISELP